MSELKHERAKNFLPGVLVEAAWDINLACCVKAFILIWRINWRSLYKMAKLGTLKRPSAPAGFAQPDRR